MLLIISESAFLTHWQWRAFKMTMRVTYCACLEGMWCWHCCKVSSCTIEDTAESQPMKWIVTFLQNVNKQQRQDKKQVIGVMTWAIGNATRPATVWEWVLSALVKVRELCSEITLKLFAVLHKQNLRSCHSHQNKKWESLDDGVRTQNWQKEVCQCSS